MSDFDGRDDSVEDVVSRFYGLEIDGDSIGPNTLIGPIFAISKGEET